MRAFIRPHIIVTAERFYYRAFEIASFAIIGCCSCCSSSVGSSLLSVTSACAGCSVAGTSSPGMVKVDELVPFINSSYVIVLVSIN